MPRGRPKKVQPDDMAIIKKKFWIWDSIWEKPREVEIERRQNGERGEFICWDAYEVEARGPKGKHFLHQIYSRKELFETKKDLCEHYIKMFNQFMDMEDEK